VSLLSISNSILKLSGFLEGGHLEIIVTDLYECELNRSRVTKPLKGIIEKLHKEGKVPYNKTTSMDYLNSLSTFGTHPKDFDPEKVKPVLNNPDIIIKRDNSVIRFLRKHIHKLKPHNF